jgi:hypothetical protein
VILQQRYPEYRDFTRQVYPEIGFRAIGKWAKLVASITIDVNQFGVCVVGFKCFIGCLHFPNLDLPASFRQVNQ